MTILTNTKLETTDYHTSGWVAIYNSCIYKLNNTLLKINSLVDVDKDGLVNGAILKYNSSLGKWKAYKV